MEIPGLICCLPAQSQRPRTACWWLDCNSGTQGQRGSYVLEPCHQGHWASSCSQACSGNWGGEICLPVGPPHAWESGTGGLRLGAQSREKGDSSAFPCLAQWCLLTQGATSSGLPPSRGRAVCSLPGQRPHAFPISFLKSLPLRHFSPSLWPQIAARQSQASHMDSPGAGPFIL